MQLWFVSFLEGHLHAELGVVQFAPHLVGVDDVEQDGKVTLQVSVEVTFLVLLKVHLLVRLLVFVHFRCLLNPTSGLTRRRVRVHP